MKISAFEIRPGNLLEHQDRLWRVLKTNHVKPGKGGAFVQVEMKELAAGTKLNERFRSSEKVEKAHVETRAMEFLYVDGDDFVFMDSQTYDQITLPAADLAAQVGFLLPNTPVQISLHHELPIGIELPANVALEVVETESVVKGQTASGSGKPARLETGITVTVPTFITVGDKVRINTETRQYVDRVD